MASIFCAKTCTITLQGGRKVEYPRPVLISELVAKEPELQPRSKDDASGPVIAVTVDGVEVSLTTAITARSVTVAPIYLNTSEGMSVYRRSLVFVLCVAAYEEFGASFHLTVEHSLVFNRGYLCNVDGGSHAVTAEEISRLKRRMNDIVAEDRPITEQEIGYYDALEHFKATERPMSYANVETGNSERIHVSVCKDYASLYYRCLAASTGVLNVFDLMAMDDEGYSLALLFPIRKKWDKETVGLPKSRDEVQSERICQVYREYNHWGSLLGVESVGNMNRKIMAGKSRELVMVSEALQNHKVVELATEMKKRVDAGKLRMVLIAGPSASGKTTFANKLGIQLRILGCTPVVLSVDNYAVPREETPRDENGKYDFEVIEALRIELLNQHLLALMRGEEVRTPVFNFQTGLPKDNAVPLVLPKDGVLIMEGIHCLNPKLTHLVPADAKFKVFVAPLSQLNLDESNFMSHGVTRLFRRIVRDYNHRGYSAADTLARWPSVARGEDRNIFPFMNEADFIFNTALDYETSVLRVYAAPLLKTVKPGSPEYNLARNLLVILDWYFPIPHDDVPGDSLLREFAGGSFFEQ